MVVLVRDTATGMQILEKHVMAITLDSGNIELIYDEEVITGSMKYPMDRYEIMKIKGGEKRVD